jgi:hypothetical protein
VCNLLSRSPEIWCSFVLWFVGGTAVKAQLPAAPEPDKRLTLTASRRDYLLGEPVVLDLTFRNHLLEDMRVLEVFVEPGHYEAPLWIAREGDRFQEFSPNIAIWKRTRRVIALPPGESLTYKYRAMAAPWRRFRLAFPTPGTYRVYAVYPLYTSGARQTVELASNAVDVHVKEPQGEDARTWQQLNNPALLALLQTEEIDERATHVPTKLAEILYASPKGGYAPALRHVLSKIAPVMRDKLSFAEAKRWGESLGIDGFARLEDDPTDKRLDAILKQAFEREMTVEEFLKSLSQAGGLPLDTTPEIKTKTRRMAESVRSVRESMRILRRAYDASWERRGDGYVLVPFRPDPAFKKGTAEKNR